MKVQRADIWLVNLEPTVGAEIRKTRPVVVVSSDAVGTLPVRLVSPLTEWKDHFAGNLGIISLQWSNGHGQVRASSTLSRRSGR